MADGTGAAPGTADLGFDPAALRAKYLSERDKRLRADANAQYVDMSRRKFAHLPGRPPRRRRSSPRAPLAGRAWRSP